MQQFFSIFVFYRPFILWSFGLNTFLALMKYDIAPIIIAKLLLVVFLWYYISETQAKQKLVFYKNLGISSLKLFSFTFLMDFAFSLPYLILLSEFI